MPSEGDRQRPRRRLLLLIIAFLVTVLSFGAPVVASADPSASTSDTATPEAERSADDMAARRCHPSQPAATPTARSRRQGETPPGRGESADAERDARRGARDVLRTSLPQPSTLHRPVAPNPRQTPTAVPSGTSRPFDHPQPVDPARARSTSPSTAPTQPAPVDHAEPIRPDHRAGRSARHRQQRGDHREGGR